MATKQPIYYTQEGYNELINELDYLKNVRRAEVIHDIEVARGFGDLSENAEYDEARTEQARVEARISELEEKKRNAVIIDESAIDSSGISVGSNEVAPEKMMISDMSPIGHALLGKRVGDVATVEAPVGNFQLEILKVERTKSK